MHVPVPSSVRRRSRAPAFTLLQLLLVIAIIVILASLTIPLTSMMRKRAERVKCISQMKSIGIALGAYVSDYGHWPQIPDSAMAKEEKMWQWWFAALEPYDIKRETWVCPTVLRESKITRTEDIEFGTYGPALFDAHRSTPYKWNQPWLVETGAHHGSNTGAHMLMPDGSIKDGMHW